MRDGENCRGCRESVDDELEVAAKLPNKKIGVADEQGSWGGLEGSQQALNLNWTFDSTAFWNLWGSSTLEHHEVKSSITSQTLAFSCHSSYNSDSELPSIFPVGALCTLLGIWATDSSLETAQADECRCASRTRCFSSTRSYHEHTVCAEFVRHPGQLERLGQGAFEVCMGLCGVTRQPTR